MHGRDEQYLIARLAVILLIGCQVSTLPRPECADPRRPAADFGPPSPPATAASISIEIGGRYIAERVRRSFETPLPASASDQELAVPEGEPSYIPQAGVVVKNIALEEERAGADRLNLLTLRIAPWIRHQESDPQSPGQWRVSKTEVQRYFALRLRLSPRLVTPATVPDPARRRTLLQCDGDPGCGASGVIVPFELYELYDVSNGEKVVCTANPDERNPSYDLVTQKLHQGVLDALYGSERAEGAPPLVLPGQKIVELVGGIAGSPVQLTGVALGTDGDLKIGFLTDQGSPMPFDATTGLSRYPEADWAALIDPSFITAAITRKVISAAAANVPPVTVLGVNVSYERANTTTGPENLIWVYAPATATTLYCSVPVSIRADISPSIRLNAEGRSALVAPARQWATPRPNACIVFEKLLFGQAQMTVCTPGPCPAPAPADPCPEMAEVQFEVGPGDVFYGTELDTDGVFYIAGRSTFLDRVLASEGLPARPPVRPCP